MTDDDIINCFLNLGCVDEEGTRIPLKNCNKIHDLYMKELDSGMCSACNKRAIKIKYTYRLKMFLSKERKREAENS